MYRHPIPLICLIATVMLSFAFFAGPGSAQQPPISLQKLEAILNLAHRNEKIFTAPESLSRGLGLTHPFTTKNVGFDTGNVRHGMTMGVSDPTRIIFYRRAGERMDLFATDRRGHLLSAGTWVNRVFTRVAIDAARASFEAEMRLWEAEPFAEAK